MKGYTSMFFSTILTKGNNLCDYLFDSLDDQALQKCSRLLKERICSQKQQILLLRINLHWEGCHKESLPLTLYPSILKTTSFRKRIRHLNHSHNRSHIYPRHTQSHCQSLVPLTSHHSPPFHRQKLSSPLVEH